MTILSNETLRVEVSAHGAELQSIRKGDVEYLWQGDSRYWGRRSPVLFPIVGSVWEARYRVDGTEYQLGQHGFARDMDFTLVCATDTEVRYRLESSDETLAKYPYPFVLEIAYRLHGASIDVIWEVKNPSDKDMYFQIGAHPAFFYPDYDPEKSGRGFFTFDRTEGIECIRIKEKGCVDAVTKWPLEMHEGVLKLEKDTFDAIDTIMVQDSQLKRVNMFKEDGTAWLSLSFDAPVVGIWSPPGKVAPFICIEPWYGRCDRVGYEGEYKDKDWMNSLAPGEEFKSVYTIEIA
ncbi:MAG: aldose 1-epimerase family protein [Bacteroidales bacterium]|nr:aldose 1-epimerase family protein [Bacteroidales bacterium]